MKKILPVILLLTILGVNNIQAQGLENIIVEKYYISDANDATVNSIGGVLPVGSVTYRIYVDMLPDYIFQDIYGDPNHECRIETSTLFFNNEDRGAVHPNFNFNYCKDNTVMLDSWLSVGGACAGRLGILKDQDDGVGTVSNNDGVLQNNDPLAGIPLTQQDGLIAGTPEPVVSVGIGTELMVFDSQNDGTNGPVFSTFNGAWASLNGSVGPDPALNQVLVAQITTDGDFSFKFNVQIRNQTTLTVENYVASNPIGNEILFAGLNYTVGLNNVADSKPTFGLYPVPAHDVTTLSIANTQNQQKVDYKIYDILGNVILEKSLGLISGITKHQVDISTLANGIYFLELNVNGTTSSKKLIKN